MIWNPEEDGKTHINVYSKGKTWVGRALSNFAHTPFEHPVDGHFESVEGYWYYLLSGQQNVFRDLVGWRAKEYARKHNPLIQEYPLSEGFKSLIWEAIAAKLKSHPHILQALLKVDLKIPLKHYYVYGGRVIPGKELWVIERLESLRGIWVYE